MSTPTFSEIYCKQNDIQLEQFPEHLILETCYPKARLVYRLWIKFGCSSLSNELDLLSTMGQAATLEAIEGMVNGVCFATYLRELKGIRRKLNLRISGSRLIKLAKKCFQSPASNETIKG